MDPKEEKRIGKQVRGPVFGPSLPTVPERTEEGPVEKPKASSPGLEKVLTEEFQEPKWGFPDVPRHSLRPTRGRPTTQRGRSPRREQMQLNERLQHLHTSQPPRGRGQASLPRGSTRGLTSRRGSTGSRSIWRGAWNSTNRARSSSPVNWRGGSPSEPDSSHGTSSDPWGSDTPHPGPPRVRRRGRGNHPPTGEAQDQNLPTYGRRNGLLPQTVTLTYVLSEAQLKELARVFPTTVFRSTATATNHSHPISATVRRMVETIAVDRLQSSQSDEYSAGLEKAVGTPDAYNLIDVGGQPRRHHAARRTGVHSCCPILTPMDALRNSKLRGLKNFCHHKAQDCNCAPNHWGAMFVHSIYYFTPEEVLSLVHRTKGGIAYSAHHDFLECIGEFHLKEASYYSDADGMVSMQVSGNSQPYLHKNPLWLQQGYFESGTKAMAWTVEGDYGGTKLVKFITCPAGLQPGVKPLRLPYQEAVIDKNFIGEVDLRPQVGEKLGKWCNTRWQQLDVQDSTLWSWRGNLMHHKTATQRIVIPKQAIHDVAVKMAGRHRDANLVKVAYAEARRALSKYNVTQQAVAASLPYVAVLGMTWTLEAEISAGKMLGDAVPAMEACNALGRLECSKDVTGDAVLILGTGAALTAANKSGCSWRTMGLIAATGVAIGLVKYVSPKRIGTPHKQSWVDWLLGGKPDSVLDGGIMPGAVYDGSTVPSPTKFKTPELPLHPISTKPLKFLTNAPVFDDFTMTDVCCNGIEVSEQERGSSVRMRGDDFCKPKLGMQLMGMALAENVPVVARSCIHNEYLAITNRVTFKITGDEIHNDALFDKWHQLGDWIEDRQEKILKVVDVDAKPYDEWLERFTPERRKVLDVGKVELDSGVLPWDRENCVADAFVKRETLIKNDGLHIANFVPRAIQGRKPVYQVATGPWTLAFSDYLKQEWCADISAHPFHPWVYTSGMDAQQLGEWYDESVDYMMEQFGSVVVIENDFSKYDATLGSDAVHHELSQYDKFCTDESTLKALWAQVTTSGSTPHGVVYSDKEGRRKSGDANTSCGNSMLNAHVTAKAYADVMTRRGKDDSHLHYRALVLGDDNFTVTHMEFADMMDGRVLEEELKSYGLKAKVVIRDDPRQAEFCSGRFWPSATGTVWGPKPARVMSKAFYSKRHVPEKQLAQWAKGVALGFARECNHVPVLRAFVARTLQLTEDVVANEVAEVGRIRSRKQEEVCEETNEVMMSVYGLTPSEVLELEDYIYRAPALPCYLSHPYFENMILSDAPREDPGVDFLIEPTGPRNISVHGVPGWYTREGFKPYRKMLRTQTCVVSPVVEEVVKHLPLGIGMYTTAVIIAVETSRVKRFSRSRYLMTTAIMHLVCAVSPLWLAIPIHIAWNTIAALKQ